jgi:hypothetical protein
MPLAGDEHRGGNRLADELLIPWRDLFADY